MSLNPSSKYLDNLLESFKSIVKKPEQFLSIQEEKFKTIKDDLLKPLYDYTKKCENSEQKTNALPELIADCMDEEQLWQQLELQNEEVLKNCIKETSEWLTIRDSLLEVLDEDPEEDENSNHEEEDEIEEKENSDLEDEDDFEENESEQEDNEDEDVQEARKHRKKSYKKTIVDDKFFVLREMEDFLDQEDRKEMKKGKPQDDSEDEEEIDYFKDSSDEEDDTENDKSLKFTDFFDPVDEDENTGDVEDMEEAEEEEEDQNEHEENQSDADSDEFDIGKLVEMEDSDENEELDEEPEQEQERNDYEEEEKEKPPRELDDRQKKLLELSKTIEEKPKSSFELRQEKLKEKIHKMENEILDDRPWQLKGEVQADNRPQNSLLEEILEFDMTTRPAPVITEETTLKLEDIIKQRIKDKSFDDVERKVKPTDTQFEYKKQLVLDQEKSKESLAKIYEKEYLKELEKVDPNAGDAEEEEPKEHKEIRSKMKDLFDKLDTLSSFFYTPKPAIPELKIITNLPTISMEEVAPIAENEATLLAPEEIKKRTIGDIIGKGERTKSDKNRERRKKKEFQKQKKNREEKRASTNDKVKSKLEKEKLISKVTKSRNVERMNENVSDKANKSSKEFFNRLQDEVSKVTDKIKNSKKRKSENNGINAKKIKL